MAWPAIEARQQSGVCAGAEEMNYLSVCSGIEAASCAWHPLGWKPFGFSEIDTFPSRILAHHYPSVPNFGDMTRFKEWPDATIDVLVGGTPCQSFSVAGLRKGLADPRGNLLLTYLAIAERYRPEWLVWENVPGVLSSANGRDFGCLLHGLEELGYGFAYRILDAKHFGIPQRRRRVFVIGCFGSWQCAERVHCRASHELNAMGSNALSRHPKDSTDGADLQRRVPIADD
jgi:DNA (cytosine-5)-methyltransferase 1